MGEMKVEGRTSVSVPDHLAGLTAAGDQVRVRAHVIDVLPVAVAVVFVVVGWIVASVGTEWAERIAAVLQWVGVPILVLYTLATVVLLVRSGQTLGMRVAGVRWVDMATGQPTALRNLAKFGLEVALAVLTAGVGPVVICLLTQGDLNRTWFDQVCGTLAIRLEGGSAKTQPRRAEDSGWDDLLARSGSAEAAVGAVAGADARVVKRYTLHTVPPEKRSAPFVKDVQLIEEDPEADEARWMPGTKASSMDLASMSRSTVDSRLSTEEGPLSDDHTLSELERSIGRRPDGSVRLLFDDGTRYDLVGTLLIGRDPVSTGRFKGAAVLAVHDSARSVSKVHLAVSVRDGQVFVEDLYSTNGTSWSTQGTERRAFKPGVPQSAEFGSTIHFGNRQLLITG